LLEIFTKRVKEHFLSAIIFQHLTLLSALLLETGQLGPGQLGPEHLGITTFPSIKYALKQPR
jgi:hypothetical protein